MLPTGTEEILYEAVKLGLIEVRPDGSVWRIAMRRKSRWTGAVSIKPCRPHRIDSAVGKGYRVVKIMIDGKQTSAPAHRLAYRVLKGKIPDGMTINHENGKKADNDPSNLNPETHSGQMLHAYRTGLKDEHGEKNPAAKLSDAQIVEIRRRYAKTTVTQEALAKDYGVTFQAISKIVRGATRAKQAGQTADYTSRRRRGMRGRDINGRFTSTKS